MADIFVSYAAEDRRKIAALADLFEQSGWSTWWDRQISAGKEFERTILDALAAARCVLVAWSRASVESEWVVTREARDGANRGILVPVLLEPVQPPAEFEPVQAARLTAWTGTDDSSELRRLLGDLSALLDPSPREFGEPMIEAAQEELTRIDAAQVAIEYCAAYVVSAARRDDQTMGRVREAYEGLARILAPISDEDLHALLARFLDELYPG